jgi:Cu(I)/Ag(I) efflux system membrane protein CusA/SilA
LIVMLSLPFTLVGRIWLLWRLGFSMSEAVAAGFIALAGVAAETGVAMLTYLDHAAEEVRARCHAEGRPYNRQGLYDAVMVGAGTKLLPTAARPASVYARRRWRD